MKFFKELEATLVHHDKPKGVGLAAPQVDKLWRVFVTYLEGRPLVFANPYIVKHSQQMIFGPKNDEDILEGCLSMPNIYGAVPRWEWVDLEYEVLNQDRLEPTKSRFADFHARVIQHELDHLNGVLFIDHSLEYDLPVFRERRGSKGYDEIPREALELI